MKFLSIVVFLGFLFLTGSCNRPITSPRSDAEQSAIIENSNVSLQILKMIQREKQLPDLGSEVDGYSWICNVHDLQEKSATATIVVFSGKSSQTEYKLFCVLEGDVWKIAREVQGTSID